MSFVREGLGCGCPDEVFSFIQIEKDPEIFHGLRIDSLVTIGDRLLVATCLLSRLNDDLTPEIRKALVVVKKLLDGSGFNRFRLVVTSEEADRIAMMIVQQFAEDTDLGD